MSNWISVAERLPPDGQEVLVYFQHNIGQSRALVGYHFDNEWSYCVIFESYVLDYFGLTVTHWMKLPESPSLEQSYSSKRLE